MTRINQRQSAATVTPKSAPQGLNIIAVTSNNTTPRGPAGNHSVVSQAQEPVQVTVSYTEEARPGRNTERVQQWAHTIGNFDSVGRQNRIAEGMRQSAALRRTRDDLRYSGSGEKYEGQVRCPVTGEFCGEKGYGPCGIHVACSPLRILDYYE
ncbi:hypothetical protein L873DRAFT_1794618 [Choiromyces venosus 120613-1]|uniref:Uncharacterized protein n=1 Tax=Choiromyces venosus 120613-1 TaxID=1336337 RepID=A0A3N4J615_9PEZI|nr:hypothetical protein L873DRAFT_1794618 [Choiromyces venosus 120613-1]